MKAYVIVDRSECYECGGETDLLFVAPTREAAETRLGQLKARDARQREANIALSNVRAKLHSEGCATLPPKPPAIQGQDTNTAWYVDHWQPMLARVSQLGNERAPEIAAQLGAELSWFDDVLYFSIHGGLSIEEVEVVE